MKIGEILRQLADVLDAEEAGRTGQATTQDIAPDLNAQAGTGESPDEIYIGPLQQKHELLKKATGVENNVDQFAADDEIAQMQQNAGIPTTVINISTAAPAESVKQVDTAILSPLADLTDSD